MRGWQGDDAAASELAALDPEAGGADGLIYCGDVLRGADDGSNFDAALISKGEELSRSRRVCRLFGVVGYGCAQHEKCQDHAF